MAGKHDKDIAARATAMARALKQPYGERCYTCRTPGGKVWVEAVCRAWADGSAPHVNWFRMAEMFREEFHTRTFYRNLRTHVQAHQPDVWELLVKNGKV